MIYDGIKLSPPVGTVSMSHSIALDIIQGKSGSLNMDYTDKLGELPWGAIQKYCPDSFNEACHLFSLMKMNYQVCNGGIDQYFYNRYHEPRDPYYKDDVALVDKAGQEVAFANLVAFAKAIYPEKADLNAKLALACSEFQRVTYEEDVPTIETIYSDEPEYIEDPDDPDLEIPNPDYEEPYDETVYENVITNQEPFENAHYDVLEYLEEVLELRAQYIFKALDRDLENEAADFPEAYDILSSIRTANAPSLSARLEEIQARKQDPAGEKDTPAIEPERF